MWWQDSPRTPRQRRFRWLLIGTPAVVLTGIVGLLVAAQVADDRAGCGSIDPTDPANYSAVTILNDTSEPVVVDECIGTECQLDHVPSRLGPGERFDDHAACAASGSDMTSWRIVSDDGRLIGYIAVDTPRKTDGLVFPISHASSARATPSTPQ